MTAAQVADRLRRRGELARERLAAELQAVAAAAASESRRESPADSGALARSWSVVQTHAGAVVRNTRPRARYVLRGAVYDAAVARVRALVKRARRRIARRLKEA